MPIRPAAARAAELIATATPRWRLCYEDFGKAAATGLTLSLPGLAVELAGWLASGLAELDEEIFTRLALRFLAWTLLHAATLFARKAPA